MLTILVSSYDVFAATWPPCWHGLQKYWPDRPWPLRFITNHLDAPCGNPIKVGDDENWTQTTRIALQSVDTPYVFWMHDDCWICGPVDTPALIRWAKLMDTDGINYIKTAPSHNEPVDGTAPYGHGLVVSPKDYMYRTALGPALWRVAAFLDTLRDGESPWSFEVHGGIRAHGKILRAARTGHFPYVHREKPYVWESEPVVRGMWQNAAHQYAEIEGIQIDFSKHPKPGSG